MPQNLIRMFVVSRPQTLSNQQATIITLASIYN